MRIKRRIFAAKCFSFKQWSRKPYAVFQSLQKLITIATLAFTYSLVTSDISVAQTDTTSNYLLHNELEEVVVSARRTPVAFHEVARLVTTLDEERLSTMPVQSAADALEYTPGIDLRQRGVNGVQADLSMRGGSFDQNLILLNGVNMTDPQTGHHNLNLPVPLSSIEKIEVLHGPAARVYGANAFSGAVNFITGTQQTNTLRAHLSAGQHGFLNTGISANINAGNTRHFAAFNHKQANDYTSKVNTDFKSVKAFYHGKIKIQDYKMAVQLGHLTKNFAANTFYSPYYNNQYEETATNFAAITGQWDNEWHITHKLYWRQHLDHFVLRRENPDYYQNYHQTNTMGANLNAWHATSIGKTSIGLNLRYEGMLSNNLGQPLSSPQPVPFANDAQYTKSENRKTLSFFAEQNADIGALQLSGGLLVNWNDMYPQQLRFYPGMDLSYRIAPLLRLYASVNRSLRLPTFTDMYYSGPGNIGNADLKPEKAWTTETGVKYFRKGLQINTAVFHRRGRDIIDWLWLPEKEKWHTRNLTKLHTTGTEIHLRLYPQQLWHILSPVQTFTASYTYMDMAKVNEALNSNYALDHLQHKLTFRLRHRIVSKLAAEWYAGYFDRNGGYLQYNPDTERSREISYKKHWKIDARLLWQAKSWNAYIEATNLLDARYHDTGSTPQPGRWIKAGARYRLQW